MIPVDLQGRADDGDDPGVQFHIKISFKALLLVGLILHVVSIPSIELINRVFPYLGLG